MLRRQPRLSRFCDAGRMTAAAMKGGCESPGWLLQVGGIGGLVFSLVRGDLFRFRTLQMGCMTHVSTPCVTVHTIVTQNVWLFGFVCE